MDEHREAVRDRIVGTEDAEEIKQDKKGKKPATATREFSPGFILESWKADGKKRDIPNGIAIGCDNASPVCIVDPILILNISVDVAHKVPGNKKYIVFESPSHIVINEGDSIQ